MNEGGLIMLEDLQAYLGLLSFGRLPTQFVHQIGRDDRMNGNLELEACCYSKSLGDLVNNIQQTLFT